MIIRAKLYENKRIYRDIVIGEDKSLYGLAEAVIDAFGFSMDHCFGFYQSPDIFGKGKDVVHYELFFDIGGEVDDLTEGVKKTRVRTVFTGENTKWWMLFDYGDGWIFELELRPGVPLFADKEHGYVVAARGDAPTQYQEYE